jgi:hypothetical protein
VKIRAVLLALAAGLCACRNAPQAYPPPAQFHPFVDYQPRFVSVVNMADPDAPRRFVRDISLYADGSWRWSQKRPAVRLRLSSNQDLKYTADFTLPDVTFNDTGPVNISFYVNDHLLDRVHYEKPGYQHFEKPVPAEWVTAGAETTVGAEIDKMWISKADGAQFGFIITRIGLTQ